MSANRAPRKLYKKRGFFTSAAGRRLAMFAVSGGAGGYSLPATEHDVSDLSGPPPQAQFPASDSPLSPPQAPSEARTTAAVRIVALLEVLLCSGYPTQIALGGAFAAFGYGPVGARGALSPTYIVGVSLADSVLVVGLVLLFLYAHRERPQDVILGRRSIAAEAAAGVPLIGVAFGIAIVALLLILRFAPALHNVERNPLQDLLRSPRDVWLFALVVIVAGGLREEIQRAFLLHRFEAWLGGRGIGLAVTSVAFGAGHLLQGADAVLATGLLGAFWGIVYLRRRSAVAPMVSHAGFDLLQIGQILITQRV